MKTLALTLSLGLASIAPASPALARGDEARSVSVRTADLDLTNAAGVQTLYARLQGAAHRVCRGSEGRSLVAKREHTACLRTAMDGGVLAANSAALSALHSERTGGARAEVAAK
jgi:UrcA family protein